MKNYELVTAYRVKDNQYVDGLNSVKEILGKHGASLTSDKDMGDRELAYPVQKTERGHYHLLNFQAEPGSIIKIDNDLKLVKAILKYLIVKIED